MAVEVEGANRVVPEEADLHRGHVERKAVEVVEDPRKHHLAAIPALRLRDGARPRAPEEQAEVRLAVVVARGAKSERRPRHPDRGWDRSDVDRWRVERAQIR